MFFGLTNSPALFQTMMNSIFKEEINEGWLVIYLDDLLIFDEDHETHRKHVARILQRLREHKLFLNPKKCEFEVDTVEYLGIILGKRAVKMDEGKLKAVKEWPTPQNRRDIQSFLGFCNFYRRFVEGFSKITKPLTELTGKKDFEWGTAQEEAFEELKKRLTLSPILAMPDKDKKWRVEADSSDYALGTVLSQQQEDGKWKPVAYLSKALSAAERNYEIYDKEMLAIMTALGEWRHYLLSTKEPIEIFTDHKNITYFRKPQSLNRRQARWVMELQDYNYEITHRAGKLNTCADALSRRPGFDKGEEDNKNVVLLKPEHFKSEEIPELVAIFEFGDDWVRREARMIRPLEEYNEGVQRKVEENHEDWKVGEIEDNRGVPGKKRKEIFWKGRRVLPKDKELRAEVIYSHHDTPVSGHPGIDKMLELVLRNYWWPRMREDVVEYVKGCKACQETKTNRGPKSTELHPIETASAPGEMFNLDFVGPLPESKGFNMIMTVVDRFTKKARFLPCHDTISSRGTAQLLKDEIIREYGYPKVIISDRGPQFTAAFMKDLLE